ncbi:MAG TPA: AAA family ATPase [Acidimicrobiales bacterium]|nr:AAA family ATPase [Acidimicrobiales bacterium]
MPQVLCPVIVGRDEELDALAEALDSAVSGRGRCAVLIGDPGIGKSRLAREVAGWAAERQVRVATGRAVPASATAPFRPLTEALLQLLRGRALPEEPDMAAWLPALQGLIPTGSAQPVATGDVSSAVRGEAVLQLLRRLAPDGLVVVLEDLHWADPDTVGLVEYLADNLSGERLLMVVTMRSHPGSTALEAVRRQRGRPGVVSLPLARLDAEAMGAMVRACDPDADRDLIDRVQAAAEGVPLLVEDLLASPGLPESFVETVRERLAEFGDEERTVIDAAAVLGRHFDWGLLPAASAQSPDLVSDTLARAVDCLLMSTDGTTTRFRHALTRDAVLDAMLPPRHGDLAAAALAALVDSDPQLGSGRRELAIDLAIRSGDRAQAGRLLSDSGREALRWGALATAIDGLRRASDLLEGGAAQIEAELLLVEALALAGRVDEAAAAGGRLITRLGDDPASRAARVEAHLRLGHAAVAASRWQMARHQIDAARRLGGPDPTPAVRARLAVLDADVAFAADDPDGARTLAEGVLCIEGLSPDVHCHAWEIVGRSHRFRDLPAARAAFEHSLVTAETADLPLWRLRALHELGTVDLFDHAGVERLIEAHRAAEQMGAMSTTAVLDLQLSAGFTCRWELDECDSRAGAALAIAEQLGLDQIRAKAFSMLTGSASMRGDLPQTEQLGTLAAAAGPGDRMLEGFGWGSRGVAILLRGDAPADALEPYARGMAILGGLPHAEPAALRALWPLLLASLSDRRAQPAIDEARRLGVSGFHLNRALIGYAEAVLAGRSGQLPRANDLSTTADPGFANCEGWADLARLCAAPCALADGWGAPVAWLTEAAPRFRSRGLSRLADRCDQLLRVPEANPWAAHGISPREADVLRLVIDGLANKEIAVRLHLSPRTVEKHVESLLRKTGARSRTQLVATVSTW